jgi:hypothetical protein
MRFLKIIPVAILTLAYAILPTKSDAVEIEELTLVDEEAPTDNFLSESNVVHTSDGSVVHTFNNVAHTSDGSVVHTFNNVAHTSDGSVVHTFNNVGHTSNGNVIHSPFGNQIFSDRTHTLPSPNVAIGSLDLRDDLGSELE